MSSSKDRPQVHKWDPFVVDLALRDSSFVKYALERGMSEKRNGGLRTLRRRVAIHTAGLLFFAAAGGLAGFATSGGKQADTTNPPGISHFNGDRGPIGAERGSSKLIVNLVDKGQRK